MNPFRLRFETKRSGRGGGRIFWTASYFTKKWVVEIKESGPRERYQCLTPQLWQIGDHDHRSVRFPVPAIGRRGRWWSCGVRREDQDSIPSKSTPRTDTGTNAEFSAADQSSRACLLPRVWWRRGRRLRSCRGAACCPLLVVGSSASEKRL